jgi:hypothetical protein
MPEMLATALKGIPRDSYRLMTKMSSQQPAPPQLHRQAMGEGRFVSPEDRDASIKYIGGLGVVDATTIGYKSPAEIDEAIERINTHLNA